MNLFRNLGGDFGISFVTTMLARREQYHQQILVSHLSAADAPVRNTINSLGSYLANQGVSSAGRDQAGLRRIGECDEPAGGDAFFSGLFLAAGIRRDNRLATRADGQAFRVGTGAGWRSLMIG